MKISRARIIAAVFSVSIALPALGHILLPQPDRLKTENRMAASAPGIPDNLVDWQALPGEIDDWLNDRFGFRGGFVAVHGRLNNWLKLDGRNAGRVIIGKDGWLFYGKRKVVETYMGTAGYTDDTEPQVWLDGLVGLKDEVEAGGAEFVIMLIPNKPTIYPEMMPDALPVVDTPSRREVVLQRAEERGITVLSPEDRLLAVKSEGQLYNKTDTHWSSRGAYEGYYMVIQELRRRGMKLRLLTMEQLRPVEQEFKSGDLATMLNAGERLTEPMINWFPKRRTKAETELREEFQYRSFKTRIVETGAEGKPTLLILGDSFSFTMLRYFQESFSRIVFVHHQAGAFDRAALEVYESDVVLFSMVERFLIDPWGSPNTGK